MSLMIRITAEEYESLRDNDGGICTNCISRDSGVEPDAMQYLCDQCDENQVFGIEELLIMGLLDIQPPKHGSITPCIEAGDTSYQDE